MLEQQEDTTKRKRDLNDLIDYLTEIDNRGRSGSKLVQQIKDIPWKVRLSYLCVKTGICYMIEKRRCSDS